MMTCSLAGYAVLSGPRALVLCMWAIIADMNKTCTQATVHTFNKTYQLSEVICIYTTLCQNQSRPWLKLGRR